MANNTPTTSQTNLDKYPEKIKMSGLPLPLTGWNREFVRTSNQSDGCPIYHLASYKLYKIMSIYGASILRIGGRWFFQREGDPDGEYKLAKHSGCFMCDPTPDEFPYGDWTFGGIVSPVTAAP